MRGETIEITSIDRSLKTCYDGNVRHSERCRSEKQFFLRIGELNVYYILVEKIK